MLKKIIYIFLFLCVLQTINAQKQFSTQPHTGAVTDLIQLEDYFFSSGEDGFIVRWNKEGIGEHLQVSDIEIKKIAVHPQGNLIAIYETDDFSIHRVSVWDWKTKTRKYAKRFSDTILSLSFSYNGTYLMIGTSSADGIIYFDAVYGIITQLLNDQTSVVSLSETSKTETTSVMYSSAGSIIYSNLNKGTLIQKFSCESGLANVCFADQNKNYLCGIKNNKIYVLFATSGKTLATIPVKNPLLLCGISNSEFYFIEDLNKGTYAIKQVSLEKSELQFSPIVMSLFTNESPLSTVIKNDSTVIVGSQDGALYKIPFIIQSEILTPEKITEALYDKILDIEVITDSFYLLTNNKIYTTKNLESAIELSNNSGLTNCTAYNNSLVLWSKGKKTTVSLFDSLTNQTKELFTPKIGIETLRIFEDKLVCVLGSTTVIMYNLTTNILTTLYTGTGLQDAVLFTDESMFVSKTAATNPKTPLIEINIKTKETVMLPVSGDVIFSLVVNHELEQPVVYGVSASTSASVKRTEIFSYSPDRKKYSTILKWEDEDTQAFTSVINSILYTNIGKNNIRNLNLTTRKSLTLERSSSLPLKIKGTNTYNLVLNKDGSVSWYYDNNSKKISDWSVSKEGYWFEF